jgi:hypothetical protein
MSIVKRIKKNYRIRALKKEAEKIEAELEPDPLIDNMKPPEELYRRIVQELKDKGIYHEDPPGK